MINRKYIRHSQKILFSFPFLVEPSRKLCISYPGMNKAAILDVSAQLRILRTDRQLFFRSYQRWSACQHCPVIVSTQKTSSTWWLASHCWHSSMITLTQQTIWIGLITGPCLGKKLALAWQWPNASRYWAIVMPMPNICWAEAIALSAESSDRWRTKCKFVEAVLLLARRQHSGQASKCPAHTH